MLNPRAKYSCEFVDDKNLVMLSKDYMDLAAKKKSISFGDRLLAYYSSELKPMAVLTQSPEWWIKVCITNLGLNKKQHYLCIHG